MTKLMMWISNFFFMTEGVHLVPSNQRKL